MSSTESVSYVITGNNIEVTSALNDYVKTKLDKIVGKISTSSISECDVHLTVNKNPKVSAIVRVEVKVFVPPPPPPGRKQNWRGKKMLMPFEFLCTIDFLKRIPPIHSFIYSPFVFVSPSPSHQPIIYLYY